MMRLLGATMTLPPQQSGSRRNFSASAPGLEQRDHALVHGAAGRDHERLAHLRERLRVDRHAVAHGIAAGGEMVRPAHHMDARAFREREHCERVRVLAADQPAHRPEPAGERPGSPNQQGCFCDFSLQRLSTDWRTDLGDGGSPVSTASPNVTRRARRSPLVDSFSAALCPSGLRSPEPESWANVVDAQPGPVAATLRGRAFRLE
jgi:hypothetical protein